MKRRTLILGVGILSAVMLLKGQDGLVGYWSFDQLDTDSFPDHSAQENHGLAYGASLQKGVKGNALYFDGKDDYAEIQGKELTVPRAVKGLREGAISLWFRVDSIPRGFGIAPLFYYGGEGQCDFFDAANQGLILEVGHSPVHKKSERLYFTIFANGCTYPSFCFNSNQSIMKERWYHLVVIVGEDYNTGYLDGEEMTGRRYNFGGPDDSQFFDNALRHERLWLGKGHWDRTTQYLKGAIDELKIFYRPLSSEMVQSLYREGTDPTWVERADPDEGSLRVYPNPAKGVLQYEIRSAGTKLSVVKVIDMTGRVVFVQTGLPASGSLDLSHLSGGLYQILFAGEMERLSRKTILLL
jgi:hypothetical protein